MHLLLVLLRAGVAEVRRLNVDERGVQVGDLEANGILVLSLKDSFNRASQEDADPTVGEDLVWLDAVDCEPVPSEPEQEIRPKWMACRLDFIGNKATIAL